MPCLEAILVHLFTCVERKVWKNIENSQNIIKLIAGANFSFDFHLFINNYFCQKQ